MAPWWRGNLSPGARVAPEVAECLPSLTFSMCGTSVRNTPRSEATSARHVLGVAADLMGWKQKWHPRSQKQHGLVRGVGVSFHTWGGRGHSSDCDLTIHPDGSVELKMGSQDLGTGTRTCILIVAADTLGLPIEAIQLQIGDTMYPPSGGSGGSTTIGGVSSSTRRAAVDARDALFAQGAPPLNVSSDQLECVNGKVVVKGDSSRFLSWKEACSKLAVMPVTLRGK